VACRLEAEVVHSEERAVTKLPHNNEIISVTEIAHAAEGRRFLCGSGKLRRHRTIGLFLFCSPILFAVSTFRKLSKNLQNGM
jgi:hypothetical protein